MTAEATTTALRQAIERDNKATEADIVHRFLASPGLTPDQAARAGARALVLVETARAAPDGHGLLAPFLKEYGLSNREGVILMCLAEAMLRVPDSETADKLIADKMTTADWARHLSGGSALVNLSTRSLLFTAKILELNDDPKEGLVAGVNDVVKRLGRPVIRLAVIEAMRLLGHQFVMGRTIDEALEKAASAAGRPYRYSFDMLGEAALTATDAERHFIRYQNAIEHIGRGCAPGDIEGNHGVSVKLSALHPRYESTQHDRIMRELVPRLVTLCTTARDRSMGLTVDAEESDRLEISLDIIEAVSGHPDLAGWNGLGVVVQAYQKRAPAIIEWLADVARRHHRRFMVRLVKGAYWDTEIKRAQELGLATYPVFTRKANSDLCFLQCGAKLLAAPDRFFPQFATHNAYSMAAALVGAARPEGYEFQRLHGMGESLHDQVLNEDGLPCRIYAPVGAHEDLLPYLVRRLLENGANSSFVNQIEDETVPAGDLARDPAETVAGFDAPGNPRIPLPPDLYGAHRLNAQGFDVNDPADMAGLMARAKPYVDGRWQAAPLIGGAARRGGAVLELRNPANSSEIVGQVAAATAADIDDAAARARTALPVWRSTSAIDRGAVLNIAADLMTRDFAELCVLCIREAGKSWGDAIADVREAIDFLRYYGLRAAREKIGEAGTGRVFACISPWNFPVAIFTGQVAGVLAAGNGALAKPAEQTPLAAAKIVALLWEAGVPADLLALLPGDGPAVGGPLVAHPAVDGVCFTGSGEVAQLINRTMAAKPDVHAPVIAETGGLNAMIVDSTALPEQAVKDVVRSAFQSSGQRCSALRLLFVQDDIADRFIDMLSGAMDELRLGDPLALATDIGPVIEEAARTRIQDHCAAMTGAGRRIHQVALPEAAAKGYFVAPAVFALARADQLEEEIFGPVLHVVRFAAADLDRVIDDINRLGYGLTLGIHSRIDATFQRVIERAHVGNIYVNRNQIGAVVGVQPFGGEGLSGTGPKAGGRHYLHRLAEPGCPAAATAAFEAIDDAPRATRPVPARWPRWERTAPLDRSAVISRVASALARAPLPGVDAVQIRAAARAMADYAGDIAGPYAFPERLPGPTGEDNELSLAGRGVFLCRADGPDAFAALAAQVAAALVCGNAVVIEAPDLADETLDRLATLFTGAGLPEGLIQVAQGDPLGQVALAGVAYRGPAAQARWIRARLAARPGALIPLIVWRDGAAAPAGALYRYAAERTVTVNTAAAGGNAELIGGAGVAWEAKS